MKHKIKIVFLFVVVTIAVTFMFLYLFYMFYDISTKTISIPLSLLPINENKMEAFSFVEFIIRYKGLAIFTVCFATWLNIESGFFELG